MTNFWDGQRDERQGGSWVLWWAMKAALLDIDAKEKGCGEQNQGDMAVPADVAAHLILIEPEIFGVFQIDLNRPACSDSQNHRVQAGCRRCVDQVIGLFARVV